MTTYKISSSNDGTLSVLDGETYDTYEAAFAALQTVARGGNDDGMCATKVDAGNETAWLVYMSEEISEIDRDGSKACARIETVSA